MERRRQTNIEQLELLIEFIEQHQDLGIGKVRTKEARATAARLWRECALRLNTEGPARTGKEWAKVWNDLKCRVRAKLVSITANQQASGGGPSTSTILSPLEDRIGNILCRDIRPLPNGRQEPTDYEVKIENLLLKVVGDHDSAMPELQTDTEEIAELNSAVILCPTPNVTGQVPSPTPAPTSPLNDVNRTRRKRLKIRHVTAQRPAEEAPRPAQANRTVSEENCAMILNIETMRAEAALRNSEAMKTLAEGFKLLAESIDRFTKEYSSRRSSHQDPGQD